MVLVSDDQGGDYAGDLGVEKSYEKVLRGFKG